MPAAAVELPENPDTDDQNRLKNKVSIKVTAVSVTWTASAFTHPAELTQEPCLNCQAENDSEKWNQRDE